KDRPVVTVCRAGVVSRRAAGLLANLGFDAASLQGGIRGWGAVWSEAPVRSLDPAKGSMTQVRRNGKGCLSYLLASRDEAVVVDPSVEPAAYRQLAEREGARITHVLETHVHADHLSRARALCREVGARLLLPPNDRVDFSFTPFAHGERLRVGELVIEAVATPGHTGESTCLLVDDSILLTGDTLFLDGVGRPDLEAGDAGAEEGARALHASLHRRLLDRFDDVLIYPAHHSGPILFDHAPIATRLSELRSKLPLLAAREDDFVAAILGRLQAKPPNFDRVIEINEGKADLGAIDALDIEAGPNRCAAG
ncbi:MAG TPA: MBL fold metallo-hydrolase, partial [Candidatus Polarisedimenticolaceae bacterium]|nr:MBL fold metallo-hydrolase [Candidatus Polarisedimenticolaceae bacterium]